jgi:hypothetical protein
MIKDIMDFSPRSSYKLSKLTYEHIFQVICFLTKPKKIIEYGILDGFSLNCFQKYTDVTCSINAYDIFEGDQEKLVEAFNLYPNIKIEKGDFYKHHNCLEDNSVDIIHIDIANTGAVYDFAIKYYMSKLSSTGILILEGGSKDRDSVWWMEKYDKPRISEFLNQCSNEYITIHPHPSITIIRKK